MSNPALSPIKSSGTSDFLDRIITQQCQEIARRAARRSEVQLRADLARVPACRGFAAALGNQQPACIAELKKASPSKGLLCPDYAPAEIAQAYAQGGAACLSVLTNAAFEGEDAHLEIVRTAVNLPILRKDFIISEYQVYETRVLGADAMLLIVSCLDAKTSAKLHRLGRDLGLDILVEVHDEEELDLALDIGARLIGVNNRNLRSFEVDLAVGEDLLARLAQRDPDVIRVAESGMQNAADVRRMVDAGANAVLIGEVLMRASDPGKMLNKMRSSS